MKYKHSLKNNVFINSMLHYIYLYPAAVLKSDGNIPDIKKANGPGPRIAFICDEMTWQDYSHFYDCIFLHPRTFEKQLMQFRPDILFCESAWSGIDKYRNCWRGRIYKDERLIFDNRKELLDILKICQSNNIKTVFWNKEDPVYFNHQIYNFTDTALKFDYILTTAAECVEMYKSSGHENVSVLPFGVNSIMFNPGREEYKKDSVVFTGSWYSDQTQRCQDLEKLLDYVISQGLSLDIYDRKSESPEKKFRFPRKYQSYLNNEVPFRDIPQLCKQYEYAVNVNTVTTSRTMFSRRLLQMAACGMKVISNDFGGSQRLSEILTCKYISDGIILIEGIPEKINEAFSTSGQLSDILKITGISDTP
ncbi:MAG: DUF3880 domain-containing protein [Oscillospiraceae bacterium]|nr:DUF3880 domain-containing protein [Oscillospiraceae bacterium]